MVKGMCGFANTLVFGTLAGFFTDNVNISPVDLLLGYPSNLWIAWTEWKGIRPKIWIPLSLLVIAGSIPGVFLLKTGDARTIKILFGFVVVFLGLEMFLRERKASGSGTPGSEKSASPALLVIIGLLSGILCGLFWRQRPSCGLCEPYRRRPEPVPGQQLYGFSGRKHLPPVPLWIHRDPDPGGCKNSPLSGSLYGPGTLYRDLFPQTAAGADSQAVSDCPSDGLRTLSDPGSLISRLSYDKKDVFLHFHGTENVFSLFTGH